MVDLDKLLHLVFPSGCIYCGRLSDEKTHGFCKDCYNSLSIGLRKTGFTRYIFEYDKKIARILKRAKYSGKPGAIKNISGLLGQLLVENEVKADIVVNVPMHRKDTGRRGYNQSSIAARKIAGIIKIPYMEKALMKIKETGKQADLGRKARQKNILGVYSADSKLIKGKNILLIDDIITTGSTLDECKKELLAEGAVSVEAAVIAYTPLKRK